MDDLENALSLNDSLELELMTEAEDPQSNQLLKNYIDEKLIISVDGRSAELNFIGKELSDDLTAVWCYFEITEINDFEEVEIENSIFSCFRKFSKIHLLIVHG